MADRSPATWSGRRTVDVNTARRAALGDGLTGLRVIEAVGAVVGLADDRGDGGPDEVQVHLVADLLECAADDGDGDWVDGHSVTRRLLVPSTVAVMSGSITVVVSA